MKEIENVKIYDENNHMLKDYVYRMSVWSSEDFKDISTWDDFSKKAYDMELAMTKIVLSHEENKNKFKEGEIPAEIQTQLFYLFCMDNDQADAKFYLLKGKEGYPLSFMICSHLHEHDHWHLELAYTDEEYKGCGYGGMLLNIVARDLQREGVKYLSATVNKQNNISNGMLESFGSENNVKNFPKGDSTRYGYEFDISKINEPKVKDDGGFGK